MVPVLIIAYGNPLRSDDGVAWQAAETLRRKLPSAQAEITCVHQLTPELAERLSRSQSVIFLDASCSGEPGKITCEPLSLSADVHFAHQLSPRGLLALGMATRRAHFLFHYLENPSTTATRSLRRP
jgi:hydrogenase maturation protease